MRTLLIPVAAASMLLFLPSASAKDGVHLERFDRDQWYAVPPKLSAELRRLTAGLRPLRVTRAALAKSH